MNKRQALNAAAPALFVLLWSTGFVGARFSVPYADPLTFLGIRFALAAALLLPLAAWYAQPFPRNAAGVLHSAVAGVLLHAVYVGGVFFVVKRGFPIAPVALIVSLQPALASAAAAVWLREKLGKGQIVGLVLGFAGAAAVLAPQLSALGGAAAGSEAGAAAEWSAAAGVNIGVAILALLAITVGTVYQKKFCGGVNLLPGAAMQLFAASAAVFGAAALLEDFAVQWNGATLFALLWLVLVLSIGAILLLLYLIKQRAAASVNALFYLTPALVAIEGYVLFGETLHPAALAGFACSLCGVYLVTRGETAREST